MHIFTIYHLKISKHIFQTNNFDSNTNHINYTVFKNVLFLLFTFKKIDYPLKRKKERKREKKRCFVKNM